MSVIRSSAPTPWPITSFTTPAANNEDFDEEIEVDNGEDPLTVVSDFDDTAIARHAPKEQFAGMSQLFEEVDQALGGKPGGLQFITARPSLIAALLPRRLAEKGFGEVQIQHGRLLSVLLRGNEGILADKVSNLAKLAERYPNTRFVLFGDTLQRDPEAYREFANRYPGRVAAIVIRPVQGANNSASRLDGMLVAYTASEGARVLAREGLLDDQAIDRVDRAQMADLSRL